MLGAAAHYPRNPSKQKEWRPRREIRATVFALQLPKVLCKMVQSLAAVADYGYVGDATHKGRL